MLTYYIELEIDRESGYSVGTFFFDSWKRVTRDIHVLFLGQEISSYPYEVSTWRQTLAVAIKRFPYGKLFDFVEFLIRNSNCSADLKADLVDAFQKSHTAYRIVDGQVVAIGNEQQAIAFQNAIEDAEAAGVVSARALSVGRK